MAPRPGGSNRQEDTERVEVKNSSTGSGLGTHVQLAREMKEIKPKSYFNPAQIFREQNSSFKGCFVLRHSGE